MVNPVNSSFLRKASSLAGSASLLFSVLVPVVAACTVTTANTATCDLDSAVICSQGNGYSCQPGAQPAASLNCSASKPESNGDSAYCCTTGSTTVACNADSAIDCSMGGSGYDCTGGAAPDSTSLSCGAGTTQPDGSMAFCCNPATATTSTCTANAGVSCITTGSTGYSCTGTDTPYEAMPTLICETAGMTGGTS